MEPKKPRSLLGTVGLALFGCLIVLMVAGYIGSRNGDGTAKPAAVRGATVAVATSAPTQPGPTATERATETPVTATSPTEPAPTARPPTDVPPTATMAAAGPTAARNGNVRAGPGTGFAVVGSVGQGRELTITGRNEAGDWFQLADGGWIAAFLVAHPPGAVPVAAVIPTEPTQPPASASRAGTVAQPNAFTCVGGCAVAPDPSCAIKGNVNSEGERFYHQPGWQSYNITKVKPEEGDRWFCTAEEAQAAGFRAPLQH